MFTDGVSDNLFQSRSQNVNNEQLVEQVLDICVLPFLEGETLKDPQKCAECIADLARSVNKYPRKGKQFEYPEQGGQQEVGFMD